MMPTFWGWMGILLVATATLGGLFWWMSVTHTGGVQ